jgi:hypothetical protein
MPTPEPGADEPIGRVEIRGELDRQAVEAIKLEVRRLGRQFGLEVREAPSAAGS